MSPTIGLSRAKLQELAAAAHTHLKPLVLAAANHRVAIGTVMQDAGRFGDPPRDRSFCFIVGDDMQTSKGPAAFHRKSLQRLLKLATHIAVNAADLSPIVYTTAANTAARGGNVVIIECRPETETAWLSFVLRHAPKAATFIRTPNIAAYTRTAGKA